MYSPTYYLCLRQLCEVKFFMFNNSLFAHLFERFEKCRILILNYINMYIENEEHEF